MRGPNIEVPGSDLVVAGASPIQSEKVIGFAKEAVFGTFVAPTTYYLPCIPTVRGNQKNIRPDQARGYRGQTVDINIGYELDITLVGELLPDTWSRLLAGCFGNGCDSFSSSGGVGTHNLSPRPQCPSFSLEEDTDIIPGEQVMVRQLAGCISDQFQIKATNQQFAQATVSLIGQKETTPTTPGFPSNINPTYFTTTQPFSFPELTASFNSINNTQLMDLTFALMNHTVRVYAATGQLYATRLVPTKREVSLTTLLDFLDTNFYSMWLTGARNQSMTVTLTTTENIPATSTPYSWAFTMTGLRAIGEYSPAAASDVIQQNVTWSVILNGTNEIAATLVNDEAGQLA